MIIQVFADGLDQPRSYLWGCSQCGGNVTAYCRGYDSHEQCSHKYNKILGIFGGNTCIYTKIYHKTEEHCHSVSSHINTGDTVMGQTGHTYDDLGVNACGMENIPLCDYDDIAYQSE